MSELLVVSGRPGVAREDAPDPNRRGRALSVAGRWGRKVFLRTIGLIVLLALWEFLPRSGLLNAVFCPPFSQVASTWWDLLRNGTLWTDTSISLERALGGFGIAVVVGVLLGLLIGWYRLAAEILGPVLLLFRNTPALALLPIFILVLGIGETSKITFVAYACVWPILLNTITAVETVDPLLLKSARSLCLGPLQTFQKIVLPAAIPTIFAGIRLAGSFALLVLIGAELIGASSGLGYLITYAQDNFVVSQMYAAILTIAMLGIGINFVLTRIERHFSTWRFQAS